MTKINDLKSSPARKSNRMGPKAASALLAEKMAANKAANVPKTAAIFLSHTKRLEHPRDPSAKPMTMAIAKETTMDTFSDVAMDTAANTKDTGKTSTAEEDTGTFGSSKNSKKKQNNKKDKKKQTKKDKQNKENGTVMDNEENKQEVIDLAENTTKEAVIDIAKLIQPGGSRAIIVENLLLKQQLIIHNRSRQRAPNLKTTDRTLLGFSSIALSPRRIGRAEIIIKPSTQLSFHNALKKRKYRLLYLPLGSRKPGSKGSSKDVIDAIRAARGRLQ